MLLPQNIERIAFRVMLFVTCLLQSISLAIAQESRGGDSAAPSDQVVQQQSPKWRSEVLPITLQVGYAVRLIDFNRDAKLDIAIVDSKRILWLENPTWKAHVIHETPQAKNDNVCFAQSDIDGDGDLDLALGHDWQPNNTASGGEIGWLESPEDPRSTWTYHAIDQEPTTHRMNFIDWDHDGKLELLVVPLKGRGTVAPAFDSQGVRLRLFSPSVAKDNSNGIRWESSMLNDSLHVMHNFDVVDLNRDDQHDLLVASFEGVHWLQRRADGSVRIVQIGEGHRGIAPALGASEIRLGHLSNEQPFIATIEPWHGDRVAVYQPSANHKDVLNAQENVVGDQGKQYWWTRTVIDDQLKWGHAVSCADLDGDGAQEIVVGVRDEISETVRSGVRIYKHQAGEGWGRTLVAPGEVAVEDLVVGDLNSDGQNEIVAVGRATHNAVIYWGER